MIISDIEDPKERKERSDKIQNALCGDWVIEDIHNWEGKLLKGYSCRECEQWQGHDKDHALQCRCQ